MSRIEKIIQDWIKLVFFFFPYHTCQSQIMILLFFFLSHYSSHPQVCFILSGEDDETDVRAFSDGKRKIFRRGQIDGFLMAVPRQAILKISKCPDKAKIIDAHTNRDKKKRKKEIAYSNNSVVWKKCDKILGCIIFLTLSQFAYITQQDPS